MSARHQDDNLIDEWVLVEDGQSMFHNRTTSNFDELLRGVQANPGSDSPSEDNRNIACALQLSTPTYFGIRRAQPSREQRLAVYQRTIRLKFIPGPVK